MKISSFFLSLLLVSGIYQQSVAMNSQRALIPSARATSDVSNSSDYSMVSQGPLKGLLSRFSNENTALTALADSPAAAANSAFYLTGFIAGKVTRKISSRYYRCICDLP